MPSFFDLLAQSSSTADYQGRFQANVRLSRHGRHDQRRRDHHEPISIFEIFGFGSGSEILSDLEPIPEGVMELLDNFDVEGDMDDDDDEEIGDDDDSDEEMDDDGRCENDVEEDRSSGDCVELIDNAEGCEVVQVDVH